MILLKFYAIFLLILITYSKDKLNVNECTTHWFNYKNKKCIKILNETKVKYTEAIKECHKLNSTLLTIGSQEENLFITSLLYDIKSEVKGLFIGLKRKQINDTFLNEFEWEDMSEMSYENWSPGEPTHWDEDCVEIYSIEISAGKWNDLFCSSYRFAICQQLIDSSIHELQFQKCDQHKQYVRYRDSCYRIYDKDFAMNWTQANHKCYSDHKNASLLWIEDSYEHSFIQYWTKEYMKSIEFWIGLHSEKESLEMQYEWINQWPVYYTSWSLKEPNIRPDIEQHCVNQDRDSGMWRNNPFCEDERAFICKINEQSIPGDDSYINGFCPKFVNSTNNYTNDLWINLHKRSKYCYWFSGRQTMDWTSASKLCRSRNGTLASIHCKHESELLKPFVQKYQKHIWIGLYQSPSGQFRWEDGSALDYTNWFPGEPTDENNELCVEMRAQDMTWNDIKCKDYKLQFVCQINKIMPFLNNTNNSKTEAFITKDSDQKTNSNTSEGLSGGIIVLILLIVIILFIIPFVCFYFWFNRDKELSDNCFCLKLILSKNSSTNSPTVNTQPNDGNDILNIFN